MKLKLRLLLTLFFSLFGIYYAFWFGLADPELWAWPFGAQLIFGFGVFVVLGLISISTILDINQNEEPYTPYTALQTTLIGICFLSIYLVFSLVCGTLNCLSWPAFPRWITGILYLIAFERIVIKDYYYARIKYPYSIFPPHGYMYSLNELAVGWCLSAYLAYLVTGQAQWDQWPTAIKIGQLLATLFIPVIRYCVLWCWQQPVPPLLKWFLPVSGLLLVIFLTFDSLDKTTNGWSLIDRKKIVLTSFLLVLAWVVSVAFVSLMQTSEGEGPNADIERERV